MSRLLVSWIVKVETLWSLEGNGLWQALLRKLLVQSLEGS